MLKNPFLQEKETGVHLQRELLFMLNMRNLTYLASPLLTSNAIITPDLLGLYHFRLQVQKHVECSPVLRKRRLLCSKN